MTAKLARHRAAQRVSATTRPPASPQHRDRVRPPMSAGLLAAAVVTTLGAVVVGVVR